MSRDLSLLEPAFHEKVKFVLGAVNAGTDSYRLRPFYTLRSPEAQARLWRQSRSSEQIRDVIGMLRRAGATYLSDVLIRVGPQYGRWATNALPGQSWHQWGQALDCFVVAGGKAIWSSTHPGYIRYAEIAEAQGLTAGAYWRPGDAVHIQMTADRVGQSYRWPEIDEAMRLKFGTEVTQEQ